MRITGPAKLMGQDRNVSNVKTDQAFVKKIFIICLVWFAEDLLGLNSL